MGHVDAEVLAEFRAGLITGRRGSRITAHLAGCDRCTALGDQLAGVSLLLASVPMPAMPDRVAERLDTVLAAEVAQTNKDERVGARPAHRAPDRRRTPRPGWRLLSARVLAPVAVVLLGVVGYGLSQAGGASTSSSAASAASAGRSVAGSSSRENTAKAAPSIAASGKSNATVRGAAGTAPQAQRLTPANFTLVAGTVDFSTDPAVRKRQIEQELGRARAAGASATAAGSAASGTGGSGAAGISPPVTEQLRACVQHLAQGAPLIRVESGRYAGQTVTLVVARTGPDDTAWIAGPDCSATNRDVLATTPVPSGISGP